MDSHVRLVVLKPAAIAHGASPGVTWHRCMKLLILLVAWCALLVLSWPLALLVLALALLAGLLWLPIRLAGICVNAVFALVSRLLLLPAWLLGYRR